jgi:hypothetical protein
MAITPDQKIRVNRAEEIKAKITATAAGATDADRKVVDQILDLAKKGEYGAQIFTLTPQICALLFVERNRHNRDFDPGWALELARRMTAGLWKKNNEVAGFYRDGVLADAQHRLGAAALANYTWETIIVFGLDRESITTVDDGRRRDAASALKMDGLHEAKLKQTIIKNAARYVMKGGDVEAALRSPVEIAKAIHLNNGTLEKAIEIAVASGQNIVAGGVLKLPISATTAFLMLTANPAWPEARVREKLTLFQTGQSTFGDNDPCMVAGELISKAHAKSDKPLSTVKELAFVLLSMVLSAQGVRSINRQKMVAAVKGDLPKAGYPGEQQSFPQAAE